MINGTSFPTVLGQELGLYNTPELRDLKDKILSPLQKTPSKIVNEYFTPDDRQTKSRIKRKVKSVPRVRHTQPQIDAILSSMKDL